MMTEEQIKKSNTVNNGLTEALGLECDHMGNIKDSTVLSKLFNSNAQMLLTYDWVALTNAYNKNSFLQTAVRQKVEDAFRNDGLIIDTKTLDTKEIEQLRNALDENGDIQAIIDVACWGRLYGGACIIANTTQDPSLPLNKSALKGQPLTFLATNRWQCTCLETNPYIAQKFVYTDNIDKLNAKGNYDGVAEIDKSRVGIFTGVPAPYLTKAMLQGWGASIFEGILDPIEHLLGAFGVTLELLSEAKIDIFKISELATTLLSPNGEANIRKRLAIATANKNYKGSLAMDANDDYQQKQISFSGIPQLIEQLMYIFCGYLRYPVSKLFGIGSSGFSSGEDDLENYNGAVEAEVRVPLRQIIHWVVNLRCLQLFGRELPDFRPRWKPLRVLSEKEQAEINSRKLADYLQLADRQMITKAMVLQKLTEDGYILFSDEEINKVKDEYVQQEPNNVDDLLID